MVTIVLTLLCPSCPLQAIVAALELDERTVDSGNRVPRPWQLT